MDEVANLTASAQISLLRVLETKKVRRLGATEEHQVDVRVLTATNEPIIELVKRGDFRQDLWQRLCETTINLPPLRERMGELRELVDWFLAEMAGGPYRITDSAFEMLASYDWKGGNIRELRNTLRAMTENAIDGLLTPLGFSEQFWNVLGEEKDGETEDSGKAAEALGYAQGKIELTWKRDEQPTFTALADDLLIALIRHHVGQPGKNSIRSLAAKVGIPKSSLATKIRSLISVGRLDVGEYERWFEKA